MRKPVHRTRTVKVPPALDVETLYLRYIVLCDYLAATTLRLAALEKALGVATTGSVDWLDGSGPPVRISATHGRLGETERRLARIERATVGKTRPKARVRRRAAPSSSMSPT